MMRPGDKLASCQVLGKALAQLLDLPWSLEVVGDGPARGEVEHALMPLGTRVIYRGALDQKAVVEALAGADFCVWPAINEAFGMALLEAQASGLPVVAGASGGVGDIVGPELTGLLAPAGDAEASRRDAPADRRPAARRLGLAAQQKVRREHDLPVAAARLAGLIDSLGRRRAA